MINKKILSSSYYFDPFHKGRCSSKVVLLRCKILRLTNLIRKEILLSARYSDTSENFAKVYKCVKNYTHLYTFEKFSKCQISVGSGDPLMYHMIRRDISLDKYQDPFDTSILSY